jgi:hypothetical protein
MNIDLLKSDLLEIYNSGNWCKDVPEFQTFPTLFDIEKPHWQYLKNNFIENVVKETKIRPKEVRAWCYANFFGYPQKKWPLWHNHSGKREDNNNWYECYACAVLYLTENESGTLFNKNGIITSLPGEIGIWYFFEPEDMHSPPEWDAFKTENRFCIATEALI